MARVRVEPESESPPFALRVDKDERASGQQPWRFGSRREHRTETAELELELVPGTHRSTVSMPGTDLGLVVEADLPPGKHGAFLLARTGVLPLGVVLLPASAPLSLTPPRRPPEAVPPR